MTVTTRLRIVLTIVLVVMIMLLLDISYSWMNEPDDLLVASAGVLVLALLIVGPWTLQLIWKAGRKKKEKRSDEESTSSSVGGSFVGSVDADRVRVDHSGAGVRRD